MKKFLLPLAMLALIAVPAGANAAACRNAKGQFAKCGTPGAMTDAQYRTMKGKPAAAAAKPAAKPAMPAAAAKPAAMAAAKPAMPAVAAKPAIAAAKPAAAAPAKAMACKDTKGKFIKCPTTAAKPAPKKK